MAAAGPASLVALAAARAGRAVQLVGRTGNDATSDSVVLDLSRSGVGHVALLRDPTRGTPLEPSFGQEDGAGGPAEGAHSTAVPEEATSPEGSASGAAALGTGPTLDAADVDLGLRYLTDFAVVVLAEPAGSETIAIVAEAARWGGARLVIVVGAGEDLPGGLAPDAIVFEAPDADPDGAFATLVGTFAAALDDGSDPGDAFRASVAADGWTASPDD